MPTPKLTKEIINAAIFGFEEQKRKIDSQIADLRGLLRVEPAEPVTEPESGKLRYRKISSAARRRMAAGQRKRWAAAKGQVTTPAENAPQPKGKLSAAGRAAIVAAMKKRWAEKKAASKK
jgi:hypothetical protein